jgi:hypothetical protein
LTKEGAQRFTTAGVAERAGVSVGSLYRGAPEAIEKKENAQIFRTFLKEALPDVPEAARTLAGDLIKMTLSEVGGSFYERQGQRRRLRPGPPRWPTCSAPISNG